MGKHDFRMIRSYLEEKGIVHRTFQRNYNPQVSCFPELFEIGNCLVDGCWVPTSQTNLSTTPRKAMHHGPRNSYHVPTLSVQELGGIARDESNQARLHCRAFQFQLWNQTLQPPPPERLVSWSCRHVMRTTPAMFMSRTIRDLNLFKPPTLTLMLD